MQFSCGATQKAHILITKRIIRLNFLARWLVCHIQSEPIISDEKSIPHILSRVVGTMVLPFLGLLWENHNSSDMASGSKWVSGLRLYIHTKMIVHQKEPKMHGFSECVVLLSVGE